MRHFTRFGGTCPACGAHFATEDFTPGLRATCSACGETLVLLRVTGVYADKIPCDDRCMYATGPSCSCACSGVNHQAGYIGPIGERPLWVTERDAKRHADKLARAEAKRDKARDAAAAGRTALVAAHPELARIEAADDGSDFMADMIRAFRSGRMSPKQAHAAVRAVNRHEFRVRCAAEDTARQLAAKAAGVVAPLGRVTITGIIVNIKDQPGYAYNTVDWKMLVNVEGHWKVWVTCPGSLVNYGMTKCYEAAAADPENGWAAGWTKYLRGREVTFTVTLSEGKDNDPLFRIGKKPSGAVLTERQQVEV